MSKDNSSNQEIPGMNINNNYSPKKPPMASESGEMKKEVDKKKKDLEKLKNSILKKYKFIQAISLIPPQALKEFIEEEFGEEVAQDGKEEYEKLKQKNHVFVVVPEEKYKEIPKIKEEIVKIVEAEKQEVWVYVKTPVDIWELCFDSKFEMVEAISMSYPLHDDGLLAGLRVSAIHKSLVLQKFDKYVVSYVLAGSIVRGDVTKTSDVDAFLIINDTDVKRMPRLELKERLRGMIYQYISEASSLAGVESNVLNIQIYLLTEFWEAVKDAQPVMFTFIRDGVPIYDKGTFMPWKALLKMGKLKPSPEAIDMFMSMGDNTVKRAKKALLDIVIHDLYWSVLTPAQAMFMLNGSPPPTHKEVLQGAFRKEFVTKEKMIEKKYADILEEIVKLYKEYEHEKLKEIQGIKVDKLIKNTEDFIARLKELRKQIEKRFHEKTIEQVYKDIFELLKAITGKKSQQAIKEEFENMVKQGKFAKQHLRALKNVLDTRTAFKKGKTDSHKIDNARKDAMILTNDLIDFSQRCELANLEKGKFKVKYNEEDKEKHGELLVCNDKSFLILGNQIKKLTPKGIFDSDIKEFNEAVEKQKNEKKLEMNSNTFELIKQELGDFELVV